MVSLCRLATAVALIFLASGCDSSTKGTPVGGTVTWRGEPLQEGSISFDPADAGGHPEGADIRNGVYTLNLRPGKYTVKIRATRQAGFDKAINAPRFEQYLPAQYNDKTTLTADIPSGGNPALAFALVDEPTTPAK